MQLAAVRLRRACPDAEEPPINAGKAPARAGQRKCPRNLAAFQPEASSRNRTQVQQGAKLCGMACHIPDEPQPISRAGERR